MNRATDPQQLIELFERDRETHIYGLADMEEPYWSNSTWYSDGDAAVGLVSDGSDWVTGYAMSQEEPVATVDLLARVQTELPAGTWVTGPLNLSKGLQDIRSLRSVGPHVRMTLDTVDEMPMSKQAIRLEEDHLDAVRDLVASDKDGAFVSVSMLINNPFVGIFEDGLLVAMAGTHVADCAHDVAAIGGVLTRPSHRGKGLGKEVVAAICHELHGDFRTIGLNVSAANTHALAIYDGLGFRRAFEYEEVELL